MIALLYIFAPSDWIQRVNFRIKSGCRKIRTRKSQIRTLFRQWHLVFLLLCYFVTHGKKPASSLKFQDSSNLCENELISYMCRYLPINLNLCSTASTPIETIFGKYFENFLENIRDWVKPFCGNLQNNSPPLFNVLLW